MEDYKIVLMHDFVNFVTNPNNVDNKNKQNGVLNPHYEIITNSENQRYLDYSHQLNERDINYLIKYGNFNQIAQSAAENVIKYAQDNDTLIDISLLQSQIKSAMSDSNYHNDKKFNIYQWRNERLYSDEISNPLPQDFPNRVKDFIWKKGNELIKQIENNDGELFGNGQEQLQLDFLRSFVPDNFKFDTGYYILHQDKKVEFYRFLEEAGKQVGLEINAWKINDNQYNHDELLANEILNERFPVALYDSYPKMFRTLNGDQYQMANVIERLSTLYYDGNGSDNLTEEAVKQFNEDINYLVNLNLVECTHSDVLRLMTQVGRIHLEDLVNIDSWVGGSDKKIPELDLFLHEFYGTNLVYNAKMSVMDVITLDSMRELLSNPKNHMYLTEEIRKGALILENSQLMMSNLSVGDTQAFTDSIMKIIDNVNVVIPFDSVLPKITDWKHVNGISFPTTSKAMGLTQNVNMQIKEIEINEFNSYKYGNNPIAVSIKPSELDKRSSFSFITIGHIKELEPSNCLIDDTLSSYGMGHMLVQSENPSLGKSKDDIIQEIFQQNLDKIKIQQPTMTF